MRPLPLSVVLVVGGTLIGCQFLATRSKSAPPQLKGAKYNSAAECKADALPYEDGKLILSGSEVPVTMSRSQTGDLVTFKLVSHSVVLEEERYESDASGFRFIGISGETFEPPIPLIRFPFQVGETWDWSGKASLGPVAKPAKAALTTSAERLNLSTGVFDCVLVTAALEAETGGGQVGKRSLKFWIGPTKGVVRREFGSSTTREPRRKPTE